MLAAFLLACSADAVAEARVAAFDHLLNRPEGYKVSFKVSRSDGVKGQGIMQGGPQRIDFSAKVGAFDFRYVVNPRRIIEIEHSNRTYFESLNPDKIYGPNGSFSDAPIVFPRAFSISGLKRMFGSSGKHRGKTVLNGQVCDEVGLFLDGGGGSSVQATCLFTPDGRLLSMHQIETSGFGDRVDSKYLFSGWARADSKFDIAPPMGYHTAALPREPWMAPPGTVLPPDDWVNLETSAPVHLQHGETTLCLFLGSQCLATQKVVKELGSLTRKYRTWVFSPDRAIKPEWKANLQATYLASISGDTFSRLFVPGTPFITVLNKKGQIVQSWYGYDAKTFAKDKVDIEKTLATGTTPIVPR